MAVVNIVVSKLDNLEIILADILALAQRHRKYGAKPEHYAVVGETLIKTLKTGLGENWNAETEEAWLAAYSILSGAMIASQEMQPAVL